MATNHIAKIRKVSPEDGKKIPEFNFIQAGDAGDVAVKMKADDAEVISEGLLAKMSLVPVGTMDEVPATGTTATDIYVW